MSDSPFDPPLPPPAPAGPAPLKLHANGLPNPMDLGKATLTEFMDDVMPYLLAGLGHMLVSFVAVFLLMAVGFGCMFGGAFVSMGVGAGLASTGSDSLAATGGAIAPLGMLLSYLGAIVIIIIGGSLLTAPFNGSLMRAVDAHRRDEGELGFGSAFDTAFKQPVKDIATTVAFQLLVLLGLPLFYIGALAVAFAFKWAPEATYLDGMGPGQALKTAFSHTREHMSWNLGIFGVGLLFGLVAGYVPILGPMATTLYWVKAYRAVYPHQSDEFAVEA